jgi:hypothetical protein
MKITAVFAAGLVLAVGAATSASALAAERLSDQAFIKANRCAALAGSEALGPMDTTVINATLKAEGRGRQPAVVTMAQDAAASARRQARNADSKDRLQAELNGACVAYLRPASPSQP